MKEYGVPKQDAHSDLLRMGDPYSIFQVRSPETFLCPVTSVLYYRAEIHLTQRRIHSQLLFLSITWIFGIDSLLYICPSI